MGEYIIKDETVVMLAEKNTGNIVYERTLDDGEELNDFEKMFFMKGTLKTSMKPTNIK